jgi:hypothetical protein
LRSSLRDEQAGPEIRNCRDLETGLHSIYSAILKVPLFNIERDAERRSAIKVPVSPTTSIAHSTAHSATITASRQYGSS